MKEMQEKLAEKQIKQATSTDSTKHLKIYLNECTSLTQIEQDKIAKYLKKTKNATTTPAKRRAISIHQPAQKKVPR